MTEFSIEFREMRGGIILDSFGNVFECVEVGGGVAVAKFVIRDDFDSLLEECLEFRMHGLAGFYRIGSKLQANEVASLFAEGRRIMKLMDFRGPRRDGDPHLVPRDGRGSIGGFGGTGGRR